MEDQKKVGWFYDYATVDTVIPFRNNRKRLKAIKKAQGICDKYNNSDKGFLSKYDYMFYVEESRKKLGTNPLTRARIYE